ncbi:WD40 repeat-like protein [Linderina pennispora]|uniref:WD40 repeat-like protein n=1 Tax=Linderina pennispora TaxID=61395 RepID=A0A1Y1VXC9_9FUNG|nr:WD40 repeat-like protein [Linderina pennispora]ORX65414.1 WD40 repeat-like protein [Linderina pennispora]
MSRQPIPSVVRRLPVTALEFLSDDLLLASNGGCLTLFDVRSSRCLAVAEVFPYARIYGIIADRERSQILVFGGKSWAIVDVAFAQGCSSTPELMVDGVFDTEDWIKAGHLVTDNNGMPLVALAFAHNQVGVYQPGTGELVHFAQCSEHCILYAAAFFGTTLDSLIVASGTVFNQVLFWKPLSHGVSPVRPVLADCPVSTRLVGHEGVVFSVSFGAAAQTVASVSDDRSVRLWDAASQTATVIYGHQARVWKCLILENYLISASEDGTCRVWDRRQDNRPVGCRRQCKKNVWALAANPSQTLVASGGGDGSLLVWPLDNVEGRFVESDDMLIAISLPPATAYMAGQACVKNEHIRAFALTDRNSVIATTHSGRVLEYDCGNSQWLPVPLFVDPRLAGYSMTTKSEKGDLIAIGMSDGSVALLGPQCTVHVERLHCGIVRMLFITNSLDAGSYNLVTVDADNTVIWTHVQTDSIQQSWSLRAQFDVPDSVYVSSADINERAGWAAIGTTNGMLLIYDLPPDIIHASVAGRANGELLSAIMLKPAIVWPHAHGKFTVSTIQIVPTGTNSSDQVRRGDAATHQNFYTGTLQNRPSHSLSSVVASRIAFEKITPGWIEQIIRTDGALVCVTFYRKRLVVVDLKSRDTLVSVVCGGAGHLWQDGLLRVCSIAGNSLAILVEMKRHSSAIRCVAFTSDSQFVFTGGASSELRCWKLAFSGDSVATASAVEWALAPVREMDSDPRIMDITIVSQSLSYVTTAAVYSDGAVKVWQLDVAQHKFICVAENAADTRTHCVLSTGHAKLPNSSQTLLVTGATSGQLTVWDVTEFVTEGATDRHNTVVMHPLCVCQGVHQSGVNTLDVQVSASSSALFVATGGDDNAVALTRLEFSSQQTTAPTSSSEAYATAHSSSVQQVQFVGTGRICSVSTDQRLALWKYNEYSLEIAMENMAYTQVADPSCMSVLEHDGGTKMLVAGIGSDSVIFSWTWVNAIGNREFYQNCADIAITGASPSLSGKAMTILNYPGYPTVPEFMGNFNTGMEYYQNATTVTVYP